jgi:hypothetical protein
MLSPDQEAKLFGSLMIFLVLAVFGMVLMVIAAIINGIKVSWNRFLMRITVFFSDTWSLPLVIIFILWLMTKLFKDST